MGTDVHGCVEVWSKKLNKWVMHNEITYSFYDGNRTYAHKYHFRDRDYSYFAALAGVRGEGPEPKGIPIDVSESTQWHIDHWAQDGHSHSYMPLEEAVALYKFLHPDIEKKYTDLYWYLFGLEGPADDSRDTKFRVVFWFDS